MSGSSLYEGPDLETGRRRVRQLEVSLPSARAAREAAYLYDDRITDLIMVVKASTDNAVVLKSNRIPFKVYQVEEVEIEPGMKSKNGEAVHLIEELMGKTVIVVTDKKKLKEGPWLDAFEGSNIPDKIAYLVRDLFGRIVPHTNALVFTGVRGKEWELSGYMINCRSVDNLRQAQRSIEGFIERYKRLS